MQLNKEKMTKNTFFYQNLIVFSWTSVSLNFFFLNQKHFEIIVTFLFLSLWFIQKKKNHN